MDEIVAWPLEKAPRLTEQLEGGSAGALYLTQVFKALADEYRVHIINVMIHADYFSLGDIAESVGLAQSHASYHVKKLVEAGLLESWCSGNNVYYQVVGGAVERLAWMFEQS